MPVRLIQSFAILGGIFVCAVVNAAFSSFSLPDLSPEESIATFREFIKPTGVYDLFIDGENESQNYKLASMAYLTPKNSEAWSLSRQIALRPPEPSSSLSAKRFTFLQLYSILRAHSLSPKDSTAVLVEPKLFKDWANSEGYDFLFLTPEDYVVFMSVDGDGETRRILKRLRTVTQMNLESERPEDVDRILRDQVELRNEILERLDIPMGGLAIIDRWLHTSESFREFFRISAVPRAPDHIQHLMNTTIGKDLDDIYAQFINVSALSLAERRTIAKRLLHWLKFQVQLLNRYLPQKEPFTSLRIESKRIVSGWGMSKFMLLQRAFNLNGSQESLFSSFDGLNQKERALQALYESALGLTPNLHKRLSFDLEKLHIDPGTMSRLKLEIKIPYLSFPACETANMIFKMIGFLQLRDPNIRDFYFHQLDEWTDIVNHADGNLGERAFILLASQSLWNLLGKQIDINEVKNYDQFLEKFDEAGALFDVSAESLYQFSDPTYGGMLRFLSKDASSNLLRDLMLGSSIPSFPAMVRELLPFLYTGNVEIPQTKLPVKVQAGFLRVSRFLAIAVNQHMDMEKNEVPNFERLDPKNIHRRSTISQLILNIRRFQTPTTDCKSKLNGKELF